MAKVAESQQVPQSVGPTLGAALAVVDHLDRVDPANPAAVALSDFDDHSHGVELVLERAGLG